MLRLRPGASFAAGQRKLSRCRLQPRHNSTEATKQPPLSKPLAADAQAPRPPKRSSLGRPLLLTTAGLTVGGAALLGYAYYDPRFRHDVEINLPFMADVFSTVYSGLGLEQERHRSSKTASPAAVNVPQVMKRDPQPFLPSKAEQKPASKQKQATEKNSELQDDGKKKSEQQQQHAAQEVADRLSSVPSARAAGQPAATAVPPVEAGALFEAAGAVARGVAGVADGPEGQTTSGSNKGASSAACEVKSTVAQDHAPSTPPAAAASGDVTGHSRERLPAPAKDVAAAASVSSPVPTASSALKTSEEEAANKLTMHVKQELEKALALKIDEARSSTLEALRLLSVASDAAAAQFEHLGKTDDSARADELLKGRHAVADEAKRAAAEAEEALRHLRLAIDSAKAGQQPGVPQSAALLESAQRIAAQMSSDLQAAVAEAAKIESQTIKVAAYVEQLEKGQQATAAPGAAASRLSEVELNALIAHAHRRMDALRAQLTEQQQKEQQNIEAAIAEQQRADERRAADLVELELSRQRAQFDAEKRQWDVEAREAAERELRTQLTRQAAAHSDHLTEVLRVQRDDLRRRFERELRQQSVADRNLVVAELSQYMARARGVEAALTVRANLEDRVHRMQQLLLASQALSGAIATGKEGGAWEERLRPLAAEVAAVRAAAAARDDGGASFVAGLLSALPEKAVARGVWTEANLRKRFDCVRRTCERVALLDDDDDSEPSLLRYALSYVQSLLVVRRPPRHVDEDDQLDVGELDTYSLLAHAAHFMAAGNLEQAVRYVSQLRGVPRRVASDWLAEARLLLETRQAASAIGAFVDARRLGSIF